MNRILRLDSYTIDSFQYESEEAIAWSVYKAAFRRPLHEIDPGLYAVNDNRTIFTGLSHIVHQVLSDPFTHQDVSDAVAAMKGRKATMTGFRDYDFPKHLWDAVVEDFEGKPPLEIMALPEGSITYPGIPFCRVRNTVEGFGPLAAWFEAAILKVWAPSERITALAHWYYQYREYAAACQPSLSEEALDFVASLAVHEFGARGHSCEEEVDILVRQALYLCRGTDSFGAVDEAVKDIKLPPGYGVSVAAHAHRTLSGYRRYRDGYRAILVASRPGDIVSIVIDLNNPFTDFIECILPLAKEYHDRMLVARLDSGDLLEQVKYCLYHLEHQGFFRIVDGYKHPTNVKLLLGDGMKIASMRAAIQLVRELGWAPHAILVFGQGGDPRNSIARDNTSDKYYLDCVGADRRPCIKRSLTPAKATIPLARTADHDPLLIVSDYGLDARFVPYYANGQVTRWDNWQAVHDRIFSPTAGFAAASRQGGIISTESKELQARLQKEYFDVN